MGLAKESGCKKSCGIRPCRQCGTHHNILLCGKELTDGEVKAFYAENDEDEEDDKEDSGKPYKMKMSSYQA